MRLPIAIPHQKKRGNTLGCVTPVPDVYSDDLNFLCLLRIDV